MRRLLLVPVLAALTGCDLPGGAEPSHVDVLHAASAISAVPYGTVRLEVRIADGSDAPLAGTAVHFSLDSAARDAGLQLGDTVGVLRGDSAVATSDGAGRAVVRVWFGGRGGRAVVRIRAPSLGVGDSAVYLLGGTVASYRAIPPDTVLYAGDTARLRYQAADATGRPVFASPSHEIRDPAIAVLLDGSGKIRASAAGITRLVSTAAGFSDSTTVAVVPFGQFHAIQAGRWTRSDIDGRNLLDRRALLDGSRPRLAPDGSALVFGSGGRLWRDSVRLVPAALGFTSELHPSWGGDTQWVYFSAATASKAEIWRIAPNGTGATLAGPAAAAGQHDSLPSVDRLHTRLAFVSDRTTLFGTPTIHIYALATSTMVASGISGSFPVFSPDGASIAYVDSTYVKVMNADGTGRRTITSRFGYYGQLAWSPDGQWLLAPRSYGLGSPTYLELLHVASSRAIRLAFTPNWSDPDWR